MYSAVMFLIQQQKSKSTPTRRRTHPTGTGRKPPAVTPTHQQAGRAATEAAVTATLPPSMPGVAAAPLPTALPDPAKLATGPPRAMPDFSQNRFTVMIYFRGAW